MLEFGVKHMLKGDNLNRQRQIDNLATNTGHVLNILSEDSILMEK